MIRVAVVGAGPSGLAAARRLRDAGAAATVFDKGRRPGGRTNTREHGAYRFDHGAPFFTVRDGPVRSLLGGWLDTGVVGLWEGRLVRLARGTSEPAYPQERYVGIPGMISLAEALAEGLDVCTHTRVQVVERVGSSWRLRDDEGTDLGRFERVIVAVPAPQAVPLLAEAPVLQEQAERVLMGPAWASMLVFESRPPMDFDGAFVSDAEITWIARDASKPGRPDAESWVVHASSRWTRAHWDVDRDEIPSRILSLLEARFGPMPPTVFERAHRWGYARASEPAPGVLYDPDAGIGAAGDWSVGGRVEGALTSGLEIADRVLQGVR